MRRARQESGVVEWSDHVGRKVETRPTIRCAHCQGHTIVTTGAKADDLGGFCRLCHAPTCSKVECQTCTPFERRLEAREARGRSLRSMGL